MRKYSPVLLLLTFLLAFFTLLVSVEARPASAPDLSTADELISAVNALRASQGLPSYTPNSILSGIAQAQAEYNLSIGTITHISADGLRPFQRALLAGYPVAGDINLGGFFSENIVAGVGLTAEGAVDIWMGDAPHQNTMLSSNLQDVGAGVAVAGNTFYYVLDAGLSTGGTPAIFTPPPAYRTPLATFIPNTPNADGAIKHIVRAGDTLGSISTVYNVSLADLLALNGLTLNSFIYPDQELIIHPAFTATPTLPTSTPTLRPSSTPWPTSTRTPFFSPMPPTPVEVVKQPSSSAGGAVIAIIIAALLAAGLITLLGARKTQQH